MENTRSIYLHQKLGYIPGRKQIKDMELYQDLKLYAESQGEELVRFTKVLNK